MSYFKRGWGVQHESSLGALQVSEMGTSAENTSAESEIDFSVLHDTVVFFFFFFFFF